MNREREAPRVQVDGPRCPFCHEAVVPVDAKRACEACMAWLHAECWAESGGCASCGARGNHPQGGPAPVAVRPIPPRGGFVCLACGTLKPVAEASDTRHLCRPCRERVPPGAFFCYRCKVTHPESSRSQWPGICTRCAAQIPIDNLLALFLAALAGLVLLFLFGAFAATR